MRFVTQMMQKMAYLKNLFKDFMNRYWIFQTKVVFFRFFLLNPAFGGHHCFLQWVGAIPSADGLMQPNLPNSTVGQLMNPTL